MFGDEILTVPVVCAASAILVLAIGIEFRTKIIPNWLFVAGLISGIVLATVDQLYLAHASGFLLGFVFGVAFFIFRIAGGGAAKLMMAIGTIAGPSASLASAAVALLVVGYFYVSYKLRRPDLMRFAGEKPPATRIMGSLFVAIGTSIGVVLLSRPWL